MGGGFPPAARSSRRARIRSGLDCFDVFTVVSWLFKGCVNVNDCRVSASESLLQRLKSLSGCGARIYRLKNVRFRAENTPLSRLSSDLSSLESLRGRVGDDWTTFCPSMPEVGIPTLPDGMQSKAVVTCGGGQWHTSREPVPRTRCTSASHIKHACTCTPARLHNAKLLRAQLVCRM